VREGKGGGKGNRRGRGTEREGKEGKDGGRGKEREGRKG